MEPKIIERPQTLCICGKKISIEKILDKSQAQFAAQLKQNGIVLPEAELSKLYQSLTHVPTEEELAAGQK